MARRRNPVRMGPISIFVLVIILCLAVLATLSFATSRAQVSIQERQEEMVKATYDNEIAAQQFVAALDATLAPLRAEGRQKNFAISYVTDRLSGLFESSCIVDSPHEAIAAIDEASKSRATTLSQDASPTIEIESDDQAKQISASGSFRGDVLRVEFTQDNRRTLSIAVRITDSLALELIEWKTSTIWEEDTGEKLWAG